MRTDPQGSYASHIAHSQAHNGRAICHDFRPADDTRRPWLAVILAAAVFALISGYVLARGGAVDHTRYEVSNAR